MSDLISVMIVDDEQFVIEDLTELVDWETLGFKIVAVAYNGRQGLRKYRECHPQLILTDIKMPFSDGIEMASKIRETDNTTPIVLLTAYEDFSYAKAAISLNITEYLVKSDMTAEGLTSLLVRLKESIRQNDDRDFIVTTRILEQFFSSDDEKSSDDNLDKYLKTLRQVVILRQARPLPVSGEALPADFYVPTVRLVDLMRGFRTTAVSTEVITQLPGGYLVVSLCGSEPDKPIAASTMRSYAEALRCHIEESTGACFSAWFISHRISFYELKRYCAVNRTDFEKIFFEGCNRTNSLEYPRLDTDRMLLENEAWHSRDIFEEETQVLEALGTEKAAEALTRYFDGLAQTTDIKMISLSCGKILKALQTVWEKNDVSMPDMTLKKNWRSWLDLPGIKKWFIDMTKTLANQTANTTYSPAVSGAIRYIHRHYSNPDLSLNDIADSVHRSVGYLCSAFKKETDVTLKNYITNVRIEEAKRLIEANEMKIYEIGRKVGYHSSQYFSQAFQKEVGMLPTEYRRPVK
ncbi:MAG: response regulator [Lachnospiraceae bacterium]|nr:response regulator [Lachnospiraceae bacterium]